MRTGSLRAWLASAATAGLVSACAAQPDAASSAAAMDPTRLPVDEPCPAVAALAVLSDSDYGQRFRQGFAKWAFYPAEALDRREVGSVTLCVQLDRDGKVLKAQVAQGSGFPVLDGSALWALGRYDSSGSIPSPPSEAAAGQSAVWLALPVDFNPPPLAGAEDQHAQPGPCTLRKPGQPWHPKEAKTLTPEEQVYWNSINSALSSEFHYPAQASSDRSQGSLLLCLSMDRNSRLIDASIRRSSGVPILDGEALLALGRVQRNNLIPKLPANFPWNANADFVEMSLPLIFQLN